MNNNNNYVQGDYIAMPINDATVVTTERTVWNRVTNQLEASSRRFVLGTPDANGNIPLQRVNETFTHDGNNYVVRFVPRS